MAEGKRAVDSDKVWTVLITNTDYLSGLLTLNYSLHRVRSAYPLVALYTDGFPAAGLAALKARGIAAQRIPYLLPKDGRDYSADPRFLDCWSKLTPFGLDQYRRIVQLDADMLVLRNMDELMDLELDAPDVALAATPPPDTFPADGESSQQQPAAPAATGGAAPAAESKRVFAAGHACVCNPLRKPHYPADWTPANCAFTTQHAVPDLAQHTGPPCTASALGYCNGGLQVVNPSAALFARIVAHMERHAGAMAFADQSVLSTLFRGRWVALPYVYNALKTLRWKGVHDAIWRDESVKNIHYILTPNPWEELDAEGNSTSKYETHQWWADANKERKQQEREKGIPDDGF